ncbi:MAG TPA: hypothetical protein VEU08_13865 [Vicinamibacterales bacterium]|nr:hypothetical protein [Vicinamibacterales bacterium]
MRWLLVVVTALGLGAAISTGSARTLRTGDDLQRALTEAKPGDTILLERGATFTGNFVLPAAGPPSDGRVITLRTAGDDGMPAEGGRISPDAAGPLAKIHSPNGSPALATKPGARGWRIALVEFEANRNGAGDIIALGDGSASQRSLDQVPSDLTLDRVYVHGDPERGQKRGIALNSARTTIRGCYVSDIKAIGQDSQAIGGWNGPGPYLIEDNVLQAAGENVMFGGADPSIPDLVTTDITVRDNILSKPLEWRASSDPGAPAPAKRWQVKNLFELKNARKVVVEHNVMERTWQQAQTGYAVLFTVRDQDGRCPWCQVEDVQFRSNVVVDVAAGIQILGTDPNHPSRQTNHIVIRDNVFDGIDKKEWGGDGYFLLLTDAPRDVTIDHNTIIQRASGGIIKVGHGSVEGLTFTNNLVLHGDYGIIGRDHGVGQDSILFYLPGATIAKNVIAGGKASQYPHENFFPSIDAFRRGFAAFDKRDYRLADGSQWRKAGTDGRDLGADLTRIPKRERD